MSNAAAFGETIKLWVPSLGPQVSAKLAEAAREGEASILRDQESRRGIAPMVTEYVDGVTDRPLEEVRPDGAIFIRFDYGAEIVAVCFEELRARSPRESGRYVDSHFAMLDGKGLPPLTVPTAEQLRGVKRVIVTNPQPYSRKLEVGLKEDGSPFVKQVDPHIFESAASAVSRQFRGVYADIDFNYVDLEGAYVLQESHAEHGRRNPSKGHRAGDKIRYPAIFIDLNQP